MKDSRGGLGAARESHTQDHSYVTEVPFETLGISLVVFHVRRVAEAGTEGA